MTKLLVMGDARSVHIERWCRYFSDEGFEVALFSLEPKTISWPGHFYQSKRRTKIGTIDYALAKKDFAAALDDFKPHIVNPHYVVSYGWLASHCSGYPVVATAWGTDLLILPQKSAIHRKRITRALEHADYCTVDNKNLHDAAARFVSPEKIFRVVMGVDRGFFDNIERAEFSSIGTLRIIAPRGLQEVYDPQTIIDAAEKLQGKMDFQIDMLGCDPEAREIGAEIESKSISDSIKIRPMMPHDKFASMLKNYDIYLSASLSDSTSVALLEAMTVGLFPVVSDIEGNREWIEDGRNGLTFEPGSAASLAESIVKAAEMKAKFASVAVNNRNKVEREAIWQTNMGRLKKLFEELSANG